MKFGLQYQKKWEGERRLNAVKRQSYKYEISRKTTKDMYDMN